MSTPLEELKREVSTSLADVAGVQRVVDAARAVIAMKPGEQAPERFMDKAPLPSADALRLAVSLSGHTSCAKRPCELCARNAALLCAQGVVDEADKRDNAFAGLDELREALSRIGKP